MVKTLGSLAVVLLTMSSQAYATLGLNVGAQASYVSNLTSGTREWAPTFSLEATWRKDVGEAGIFADDMLLPLNGSFTSVRHVPFFGFVVRGFFEKKATGPYAYVKVDPLTLAYGVTRTGGTVRDYFSGFALGFGVRTIAKGETGFAIQPHVGIRLFYDPNLYITGLSWTQSYSQLLTVDLGIQISLL
jgi:hypothetical protein